MCNRARDSCLSNQIKDLWIADQPAQARNQSRYLVSRFGQAVLINTPADIPNSAAVMSLAYSINQIQDTLLTLEMTADSMRFIRNTATGRIVRASASDFVALSQGGTLAVVVANTGSLAALFTLTFECSDLLHPVPPANSAIDPSAEWTVTRRLLTRNPNTAENNCTIGLYDAEGVLQEELVVFFRTNTTCICLGACECNCQDSEVTSCVSRIGSELDETDDSGGSMSWLTDIFDGASLLTPAGIGALIGIIIMVVLCCYCLKLARPCCSSTATNVKETILDFTSPLPDNTEVVSVNSSPSRERYASRSTFDPYEMHADGTRSPPFQSPSVWQNRLFMEDDVQEEPQRLQQPPPRPQPRPLNLKRSTHDMCDLEI
jgi:hypothetical protein